METNTKQEKTLIDIKQLAEIVGVPVNTIYFWISRKRIPYIKAGKHLRFHAHDVINHLKKNYVTPVDTGDNNE
jgi:excisionase family DNA binding protein